MHWRGDPAAGELVDEAIARLIASTDRIGDYLGGLGEGERAELRGEAVERVNMFLECFPPLEARWRPVAESRLRADLAATGSCWRARSTSPSAGPTGCGPARCSST